MAAKFVAQKRALPRFLKHEKRQENLKLLELKVCCLKIRK
jgi:hypothetical protein